MRPCRIAVVVVAVVVSKTLGDGAADMSLLLSCTTVLVFPLLVIPGIRGSGSGPGLGRLVLAPTRRANRKGAATPQGHTTHTTDKHAKLRVHTKQGDNRAKHG